MNPVDRFLAKLPNAKKTDKGWSARCPAHDDQRASLSIAEGADGRALIKCHAGCSVAAICDSVGLQLSELSRPSTSTVMRQGAKKPENRRHNNGKPAAEAFASAENAMAELERKYGARSSEWTYHDARGNPVGKIVRWDGSDGKKEIRPVSRNGEGWFIGGMPAPRPLYGLPELAAAQRVYVCEGEKAADAARSLVLVATTSAHGSQSPDKTDWRALAGKEVVLLPDNDTAGRKYADAVAGILATLTPPPTVKIVELPGLTKGGDIVEWIEAGNTKVELTGLTDAAPAWSPVNKPWDEIDLFVEVNRPEFPTHVLPEPLRTWVQHESRATQTPAVLAGLLALAVCSACIARRVVVAARPGWREPVNLYVSVLLEPGNRKSAVFYDATKPLRELEAELIESARPEIARDQSQLRMREKLCKKLEEKAANGDLEAAQQAEDIAAELAERAEPVLPRLLVDDATCEKLGMILGEQGGRIASMSAEGGVFDLMAGLYSKSGTPQFDVYLKGHSGDDLITDRVSRKGVNVERPAITCAYAMQPIVLARIAENAAFRGRGLLARFLYAAPRSWIGSREIAPAPVPDAVHEEYRQAVRALADIDGELVLKLSADASELLIAWETEIEEMLGDGGQLEVMRDWGAKLAGATLRIAAVLHCVANGPAACIDRATIAAAIEIARYLIPHANLILNMMSITESADVDDASYILRWIERHGLREFTKSGAQHHGKRRFPKADDIDPALAELTRRHYIRLRPTETTGPGRAPSPTYEVNPAVFAPTSIEKRSHNSGKSTTAADSGNSGNIGSALDQIEPPNVIRVTL